jgi:hypothetical protein
MLMTIEDGLTEIADSAMALRYLLDGAEPIEAPDRKVLGGLADMLEGIAKMVQHIKGTLSPEVLSMDLERRRGAPVATKRKLTNRKKGKS